ncbi:MAG: hypothetical protein ACRD2W_02140 [Acidimicrobiales bacterium]
MIPLAPHKSAASVYAAARRAGHECWCDDCEACTGRTPARFVACALCLAQCHTTRPRPALPTAPPRQEGRAGRSACGACSDGDHVDCAQFGTSFFDADGSGRLCTCDHGQEAPTLARVAERSES